MNCHKIKLRSASYWLVYGVEDDYVAVTMVAVGKRERGEVYSRAHRRI
jgi:mRNA interferase RelE/StbE